MSQALTDIRSMRAKANKITNCMILFFCALAIIAMLAGNSGHVCIFLAFLTYSHAMKAVLDMFGCRFEQQQIEIDQQRADEP